MYSSKSILDLKPGNTLMTWHEDRLMYVFLFVIYIYQFNFFIVLFLVLKLCSPILVDMLKRSRVHKEILEREFGGYFFLLSSVLRICDFKMMIIINFSGLNLNTALPLFMSILKETDLRADMWSLNVDSEPIRREEEFERMERWKRKFWIILGRFFFFFL